MSLSSTVDAPDASGAVETAYRFIRQAIISGDLAAGETLQEARLAELIGVSRTPVREALSRLSNEGLVVLERYRRGQVASFTQEDVAEVFRLRAKLEGMLPDAPQPASRLARSNSSRRSRRRWRQPSRAWAGIATCPASMN
jgi:DNA-binding GntR family transcriptional regulator